jgi:hypothetical protein
VANTRVCAITGVSGVPVGTLTDPLLIVTTGAPPANTRRAPTTNCPVTHGGVDVVLNPQAAIAYGLAIVTMGCPDNVTRGNGDSGVACPACAQITVAPRCTTGAGMARSP